MSGKFIVEVRLPGQKPFLREVKGLHPVVEFHAVTPPIRLRMTVESDGRVVYSEDRSL